MLCKRSNTYSNYYLKSIKYNFTYAETNYRKCVSQNTGMLNNYFNVVINCLDSNFSSVELGKVGGFSRPVKCIL
jgi:hypothetical protein